jgi:hypothetical protein
MTELQRYLDAKDEHHVCKKGLTRERWLKRITLNGNIARFKQIMRSEIMSEFEKAIIEQTETIDALFDKWAEKVSKLKTFAEEQKTYLKKCSGDIKDSVEKLRQSLEQFNKAMDDNKLKSITNDIVTLKQSLVELSRLEKTGILGKIIDSFRMEETII